MRAGYARYKRPHPGLEHPDDPTASLALVCRLLAHLQRSPAPAVPQRCRRHTAPPVGCPQPRLPAPPADSRIPAWLVVDSAGRTVTLTLEVTAPAGAPSALINGYRAGEARIVVPLGWTVKWDWRSADSTAPHSLVGHGAAGEDSTGGRSRLVQQRHDPDGCRRDSVPDRPIRRTFVADEAGWYWMHVRGAGPRAQGRMAGAAGGSGGEDGQRSR